MRRKDTVRSYHDVKSEKDKGAVSSHCSHILDRNKPRPMLGSGAECTKKTNFGGLGSSNSAADACNRTMTEF